METKSWKEIKDNVYGIKGTERRDELDRDFASFKIGVLLWFNENYNLFLGIDVNNNNSNDEEKQRIREINGSNINWIKTIPFDDNFNNIKWEEVLEDNNINEIVRKINQLIEEIHLFKTE